jgi:hypothetical protein
MRTDAEISDLWQMAHLKFHFGEKAVNSLLSRSKNLEREAPPIKAVAPNNGSLGETRKEPPSCWASDLPPKIA